MQAKSSKPKACLTFVVKDKEGRIKATYVVEGEVTKVEKGKEEKK